MRTLAILSDLFCLTLCYFVFVVFSSLSIAITSLGEDRANLSVFRTFVRFCLFPLPLGVWKGLRFRFYHRHSALVEKYSVSLKTLLQQVISEQEFYGDLVYRFRKIVGKSYFSEQFRKLINCYKRIGYSLDIMRQIACVVVNPIIANGYASLFNCTTAVRVSDSMTAFT